MHKTHRTDDLQGIMLQLKYRGHGVGRAFKGDIHQIGYDDIIIMMPKGYLIKTVGYGKLKERLSAIPST